MAVKIVRKPTGIYRAECPFCYALLEYKLVDVEAGTVKCPSCSNYIDQRTFGYPVRETEEEQNVDKSKNGK